MREVTIIRFNNGAIAEVTIKQPKTAPAFQTYGIGEYPLSFLTLMRSTGIKDTSDKEIYEGDIVQSEYFPRSTVEFDDGSFILQSVKVKLLQRWLVSHFKLTVIGNIHENPELLA